MKDFSRFLSGINLFFKKLPSSSTVITPTSLGECLKKKREEAGISIEEAAWKVGVSVAYLQALESTISKKERGENPDAAYQRLVILRYAKFLSLPLEEIKSELPLMALLNPPKSSFLKNWNQEPSLPKATCWQDPSSRFYFPPRLGLSLKRLGLLFFLIISFVYGWEILRHFYRIIAHCRK